MRNYEERLMTEIYQLFRTIQYLCLKKNDLRMFNVEQQSVEDLTVIQKTIESYYFSEPLTSDML